MYIYMCVCVCVCVCACKSEYVCILHVVCIYMFIGCVSLTLTMELQ